MTKTVNKSILEKVQKIRCIVSDVDGVLTSGNIIYDDQGVEYKSFHVRDGQIIKPMQKLEFTMGIITGRDSEVVRFRCNELNFDFQEHGIQDKVSAMEKNREILNISWEEIAYIGDDLGDLKLLKKVGLSFCPKDAPAYIKNACDHVLENKGGKGCLREVSEFILKNTSRLNLLIEQYN